MKKQRNLELAAFLQSRRERLAPEQAGFPSDSRRRTSGLRRSEVAFLAGVSTDWYTWMEQGRDIQISEQVADSVARALQLNEDERGHFFLLSLGRLPVRAAKEPTISTLLQQFLDQQYACPAFVSNSRWDIVAWNEAACRVYGDYSAMSDRDRNSIWRMFTSPYSRELLGEEWEANARKRMAQFRAGYAQCPEDPWWLEMIEELQKASKEFRLWWPLHDVSGNPEGQKLLHHPTAGMLRFSHLSFRVADTSDLLITINMPSDDHTSRSINDLLNQTP